MNHGNLIKCRDIIRFRTGKAALMRVVSLDTLCGYVTYHGIHLYGEKISVAGEQCRPASKDDINTWEAYRGQRRAYALDLNLLEDLEEVA